MGEGGGQFLIFNVGQRLHIYPAGAVDKVRQRAVCTKSGVGWEEVGGTGAAGGGGGREAFAALAVVRSVLVVDGLLLQR